LCQQLLEARLPSRQLTFQRDHLAEVIGLVEQRTNTSHTRASREDLRVQVGDLIGHIIGGALQAGAPADSRLEATEKRIHLRRRQLEHEVAGGELGDSQVEAGVVELPAVDRCKIDHLVDSGRSVGDLETDGHHDHQLSV